VETAIEDADRAPLRRVVDKCKRAASIGAMIAVLVMTGAQEALAGDPVHGEEVYQTCMACHSLDQNNVGPKHRDVFGRKAGAVADFEYSPALKQSGITWSEDALDKWLTDPQAFVPGSKMLYWVEDVRDRADVIAYLKKVGNGQRAALPAAGH
jgi:cytochrome c